MIQSLDLVVKHAPDIEHAFLWPADMRGQEPAPPSLLCDLCEKPVTWGERVIGYPTATRGGFLVHGGCWARCAERLSTLLRIYA